MDKPTKEKEAIKPLEGKTDDPARQRLRDIAIAREVLAAERGCEPMIPGITRETHIAEMRDRGATEEYIASIYESVENS